MQAVLRTDPYGEVKIIIGARIDTHSSSGIFVETAPDEADAEDSIGRTIYWPTEPEEDPKKK